MSFFALVGILQHLLDGLRQARASKGTGCCYGFFVRAQTLPSLKSIKEFPHHVAKTRNVQMFQLSSVAKPQSNQPFSQLRFVHLIVSSVRIKWIENMVLCGMA